MSAGGSSAEAWSDRSRWSLVGLVCAVALLSGLTASSGVSSAANSSLVPSPTVVGPIPDSSGLRGRPRNQSLLPLAPQGYVEQEFFYSGIARDFAGGTAPYTSRILLRRPLDPKKFNGTILVEWYNVTGQEDSGFEWPHYYHLALRDGYAVAEVSAQKAGLDNTRGWDPVRYESLGHPGDTFSFDIYAQAIKALRNPSGLDPLAGLKTKDRRAIAVGLSQSGTRLHTYVDRIQNQTRVVDAFLILGNSNPVFNVDELDTPVIQYMSESEINGTQPSTSPFLRLWHVVGTAHGNTYGYDYYEARAAHDHSGVATFDEQRSGDYGQEGGIHLKLRSQPPPDRATILAGCANGSELPDRYVISMAAWQLNRWIRKNTPAIQPPLATLDAAGNHVRDQFGNALGGMRLPPMDVPVATYTGEACPLIGSTIAFDDDTLRALYPTHDDYVAKMQAATDAAVDKLYILPEDATDLMTRVRAANIPPAP